MCRAHEMSPQTLAMVLLGRCSSGGSPVPQSGQYQIMIVLFSAGSTSDVSLSLPPQLFSARRFFFGFS